MNCSFLCHLIRFSKSQSWIDTAFCKRSLEEKTDSAGGVNKRQGKRLELIMASVRSTLGTDDITSFAKSWAYLLVIRLGSFHLILLSTPAIGKGTVYSKYHLES